MLTKIIYKNFRSNFKNYVAFFIGNMMGVTEFFVFWGLYSIVKNMPANSVMLEDTLEEIIISVSVITIFSTALMVYSMLNYIKKRIADYSLFYILGMKKQKLYVFVFSEYLAGWMVSLLIGLGIGRGILYLIQQIWHKLFPTYISLCSVGTEIYFNTCKISFFIMLAVVFVLLIWADNSGISRMIAGNEIKEKRPKSIYWSICIVIGGGLLILGYWSYPNNTFTGYVLSHVEWIMGGFLILIFGGGILLEIIHSHLKFYLKNLLKLNQLYSKYQTNVLVLLMFLSLHFIALSYCTANVCELLPINGHEKYYPYQAIWMNRGEKGDISQLEEQEKHALQTKVKILEERYQEMLKSRKVVHDMKNHILALKNYDQEQNWPGLHEYLNELSDDMLEYNFHVWTGNHMLDMILNQKEKDAQNQNTVMQIDTEVFSTLPFTGREIISLFGNLLDNALEACEKINDKERWIKIKIKKKNLLLYIEIANALEEMPKQIQKEFVSNKKDNGLHGYGMKNIQDIVKKYDGIFAYKVYEDHLIFMISIYNN